MPSADWLQLWFDDLRFSPLSCFDIVACVDIFVLLPIRKTIEVFVFAWIDFFADPISLLVAIPLRKLGYLLDC